ncbi:hypothetical protein NDA00_26660 [Funiculus sociatus GB2-M2]
MSRTSPAFSTILCWDCLNSPSLNRYKSMAANGIYSATSSFMFSLEKDAKNYASRQHICFRVRNLTTFQ